MTRLPDITPGPEWRADGFTVVDQHNKTIAMVWPDMRLSSDESLARMNTNAKAIAAVPAMLEALNEARQFVNLCTIDADYEVQDEARTALGNLDAALRLAGATDD